MSFDLHAGPFYVVVDPALLSLIGGVILAVVAGTALWVTRRRRN
jgi:LPXTG-motif cell wall-anchored protein